MTDEERKELLAEMRYYMAHGRLPDLINVCGTAADEIERLADRIISLEIAATLNLQQGENLAADNDRLSSLAQSHAEPVYIVHNHEAGFKEVVTRDTAAIYDNNPRLRLVEEIFDFDRKLIGFRVYDAPPRPDASAGLIEAGEMTATRRSLLRPANQKPTICYCKSGECSAPKPEWCIGRRYADGFREDEPLPPPRPNQQG